MSRLRPDGVVGRRRRPRPAVDDVAQARRSTAPLPDLDLHAPRWDGGFEQYGGARVFVRRLPATSPDAQPAMFVHGLAGSATNWTDFGLLLRDRLDSTALDLPGYGRSGPAPRGDYRLPAMAAIVTAAIEADGRGPVHLVGNSMGGSIAIQVAARRPDLVRTLTLISPAVPDLRLRRPGTDTAMALLLLPGASRYAQRRMAAISPASRAGGIVDVVFARPGLVPAWRMDEAVEDMTEHQRQPWAQEAFMRSTRALVASYLRQGSGSTWRLLGRITAPTLVVWGAQDRLVPVTLAARVTHTLADGRLLVLPEVGHCAQMEDPVATARAVLALLDDAQN